MIDLNSQNEWQYRDPSNGLIFPWYTKPALDEIVTWDLKDKVVFEYGCGPSTLWWAEKAKEVCGVEHSHEYFHAVHFRLGLKGSIYCTQNEKDYTTEPRRYGRLFDIIIIDGSFRDACVPVALECLKTGGKLIFDNWMQTEVEMQTEETQRIVLTLPHEIYRQTNPPHPHWQTLIATKPYPLSDPRAWEETNSMIEKINKIADAH